ncbi:hypothetical protein ACLI09_12950 [Flavobacterium sp. RHBU_24]|uniref:hypothetical protein n=1 Tax=Flavobacterium sp. RHBU_24 TaxID=3391185 RepID=UPI0039852E7F
MKTLACLLLFLTTLSSCDKNASLISEEVIDTEISNEEKPTSVNITPDPNAKQLVGDKTIYEFINSIIASDTSYFNHCNTIIGREYLPPFMYERDSLQIVQADSIFTKADADFIFKQARYSTTFKLNERNLAEARTVVLPEFEEALGEKRHKFWERLLDECEPYCLVSMPLFSADFKTAMIRLSYSCGALCGTGGLYIYRKTEGKWELIATWNEWVS